jgi:hypothetical protein
VCLFQGLVQAREDGDEAAEAGEGEDAEYSGAAGMTSNNSPPFATACPWAHATAAHPGRIAEPGARSRGGAGTRS